MKTPLGITTIIGYFRSFFGEYVTLKHLVILCRDQSGERLPETRLFVERAFRFLSKLINVQRHEIKLNQCQLLQSFTIHILPIYLSYYSLLTLTINATLLIQVWQQNTCLCRKFVHKLFTKKSFCK